MKEDWPQQSYDESTLLQVTLRWNGTMREQRICVCVCVRARVRVCMCLFVWKNHPINRRQGLMGLLIHTKRNLSFNLLTASILWLFFTSTLKIYVILKDQQGHERGSWHEPIKDAYPFRCTWIYPLATLNIQPELKLNDNVQAESFQYLYFEGQWMNKRGP